MDPSGTVGRIYIEDHYTLLHTKYESSGHCGGGEDFFMLFFFFHCMSMGAPGRAIFLLQGHSWQDSLRGPLHIATYKI